MDELELSASSLAEAFCVLVNRIILILKGQRGVSADTVLRLGKYFGTSPEFWHNFHKT